MTCIAQTLKRATQKLMEAGVNDTPQLDAELLLGHSIKRDRTYLYTWPEKALTQEQLEAFETLLTRRQQGHPIAHILGHREFWGLDLKVNQHTLIPRPDTEVLIETVLALPIPAHSHILDLGTGSGAIALALKSEMDHAEVKAVDFSHDALAIAKYNAENLGLNVQFFHSDWYAAVSNMTFDCIVSNPPYIEVKDPHLNEGDVRFEPISALTSGADGLDDIRTIISKGHAQLNPNGWLVIEHGYNQADAMQQIFMQHEYQHVKRIKDYAGNPRVTLAQKSAE